MVRSIGTLLFDSQRWLRVAGERVSARLHFVSDVQFAQGAVSYGVHGLLPHSTLTRTTSKKGGLTNRSRTGWDVRQRGSERESFELPPDTFLGVFNDNTAVQQFLADSVGGGEVAGLAGGGALAQFFLHDG